MSIVNFKGSTQSKFQSKFQSTLLRSTFKVFFLKVKFSKNNSQIKTKYSYFFNAVTDVFINRLEKISLIW